MLIENVAGSLAFITSVIGLFPQIIKSLKTRSTDDLSMLMLINFNLCSLAWIIYGAYSNSWYVQLSNILGLLSGLLLVFLKIYFDFKQSSKLKINK